MGGSGSKPATPSIVVTRPTRIVQNFLLVWLDAKIDESDADSRHTILQLRRIVNTIHLFTTTEPCLSFLNSVKDEHVFLIVSGQLGEEIVPQVHSLSQVYSIYIFCKNLSVHQVWSKDWSKIQGVFSRILPICQSLKQVAQQCDQNSICVSFVSQDDGAVKLNFNQLDPSFMYTQILKEILLEIKYNKQFIREFAEHCRSLYSDNEHELKKISRFEREYNRRSPIWWYTYDCCIYSMLNRALRSQEVDTIISMGFFVQDLHRQIERLHRKQVSRSSPSFLVYRGQSLSSNEFARLEKSRGGLISFNNFLSTTKNRNVSLDFTRQAVQTNPKSVGILFMMNIDPSISSASFARLDRVSFYKDAEEEVLFAMHTVFRIGSIEERFDNGEPFWQVELTLTTDNDRQLSILTERIREETQGETGWPRLANLLIRLRNFHTAKQVYEVLLKSTVDEIERARLCHQIGMTQDNQSQYTEAISSYEKSLEIYKKYLSSYHPCLAMAHKSIALVHNNMTNYSQALQFYHQALMIEEYILPAGHSSLAVSYNDLGLILTNLKEYSKALLYYEKSLQIYRRTLPANHPFLATCWNNIGMVYQQMKDCPEALKYYERAVEIGRCSLSINHPDLQVFKDNLHSMKLEISFSNKEQQQKT